MMNKTMRNVLGGIALLVSMTAGAQEYAPELQLSDDEAVCWYRICNAAPGMEGYAMTDANAVENGGEQDDALRLSVYLLPTEAEDFRSQWKLTAGEDGKVVITNRATGSQISNHSVNSGDHNFTWLTFSNDAPGFAFTSLGDDAYRLAVSQFGATDLDILSENIGIQNLCYAYVLKQGSGPAGICQIIDLLDGYDPSNMNIAKELFERTQKLSLG